MKNFLTSFLNFVREQGIVGLAVGLAIGVQAGAAVSVIVKNFIDPIVGFIVGGSDLSNLTWETGLVRDGTELVIGWGAIVSAIITLVATALVIFFFVEKAGLTRLDKKQEDKK